MEKKNQLQVNWLAEEVQVSAVWETSNLRHKIKVHHIFSHAVPDYEAFRPGYMTPIPPTPSLFINGWVKYSTCGVEY